MSEPQRVTVTAPAKINLFLHAGEKRADGYHDLQSMVVFADAGDELMIEKAEKLSLEIDGPFASDLARLPDNLILKAARALASELGQIPAARVRLTKNLPVASGLGGGSADAAATLRGLMTLWNAKLPDAALTELALSLGSDVPACLLSAPLWMEGRGEKLTPLTAVPALPMILINPGVSVSTPDVFAKLEARRGVQFASLPRAFDDAPALLKFLAGTTNDLEAPARQIAGDIRTVLIALEKEGALLARMSGSGATCFGIFENAARAETAAAKLEGHSGWWVRAVHVAPANIGDPKAA
ncbi:MAG TPA: 4-(cytidine 5'-diphospho)-2-C-methyl-D-erythritol kinase [Rhizomicrobium sp.]|nr:4-(cytidine 5'-diphospho)-2-C-methyl-D-erythritol kinase [Rhizomicrobium sp.]